MIKITDGKQAHGKSMAASTLPLHVGASLCISRTQIHQPTNMSVDVGSVVRTSYGRTSESVKYRTVS